MRVLSLFDGISCGRIALERAGLPVTKYFASEIDKHAIKISKKNYPDIIQLGCVKQVVKMVDAGLLGHIDLLIAGSPCQGFSFAGKQLAFDDSRSVLFFDFVYILQALQKINPNIKFLLENVRMKKEHLKIVSNFLNVDPVFINSNLVSAQNRQRFYWANFPIVQPEDKKLLLKDIWLGGIDITKRVTNKKIGTLAYKKAHSQTKTLNQKSNCLLTAGQNISNSGCTNIKIENRYYTLSPVECERLQTLPINYTDGVSNTSRYHAIGNGWTVDVVAHIFRGLK